MTFPLLFFSYNLLTAAHLKSTRNVSASIISTGASFSPPFLLFCSKTTISAIVSFCDFFFLQFPKNYICSLQIIPKNIVSTCAVDFFFIERKLDLKMGTQT